MGEHDDDHDGPTHRLRFRQRFEQLPRCAEAAPCHRPGHFPSRPRLRATGTAFRPVLGRRRERLHAAEPARLRRFHDNLSQNGDGQWNRVITPNLVNTASITISRLAHAPLLRKTTITNDIVVRARHPGRRLRRQRRLGRALVQRAGLFRFRRHISPPRRCTPGTRSSKAGTPSAGSVAATA